MIEGIISKVRTDAETEVERVFKHVLVELYMKGFLRGLECAEDKDVELRRLTEEAEALEGGAVRKERPLERLKPDAILKRRLNKADFNTKVWRTLNELNCETLGDILQISEKFYLSRRGFGMGSLNVLRKYVKQFGYKLKDK